MTTSIHLARALAEERERDLRRSVVSRRRRRQAVGSRQRPAWLRFVGAFRAGLAEHRQTARRDATPEDCLPA